MTLASASPIDRSTPAAAAETPANPVLVEWVRGPAVESFHRGAAVVCNSAGKVLHAWGDIERPIYPRSANKLLQALPLVASGAAADLQLSDAELALACASHSGEPHHVATAAQMLARCGLDANALECGAHLPYDATAAAQLQREGQAPTALHNNCSGKHAGFACLACALNGGRDGLAGFFSGYVQPDHPVMQRVTAALGMATGVDLSRAARGTDGCSIPTYALPLRSLATAFARVATGDALPAAEAAAAARLRSAIARHPEKVGGTGRTETRLMQHFGARLCCKPGAEGVYTAALPEAGVGLAIKMDDGTGSRASEVVLATLLQRWLGQSAADRQVLKNVAEAPQRNWQGVKVGQLRPTAVLAAG